MPELGIDLRTNTAKFQDDMRKATTVLTDSCGQMQAALSTLSKSFVVLEAIKIGKELASGLSDAISEATEAEKIVKQLEATLQATGKSAKTSTDAIGEMASKLSTMTGFDDEPIMQMQSHLLAFANIAPSSLERVSMASLDLASKMQVDLPQAAKMLGKVLNQHTDEVGKLAGAGVSLTEVQKQQIASFNALGDAAGAQGIILDAVERAVGGLSTAARNSVGGAWQQLGNEVGNFLQQIGETPGLMESVQASLEFCIVSMQGFTKIVATMQQQMKPFIDQGLKLAHEWIEKISQGFDKAVVAATRFGTFIQHLPETAGKYMPRADGKGGDWVGGKTVKQVWDESESSERAGSLIAANINPFKQTAKNLEDMNRLAKARQAAVVDLEAQTKAEKEHGAVATKTAQEAKTEWQLYREELEKLAKTDIGAAFHLAGVQQEEEAVKKAQTTLLGYISTIQRLGSTVKLHADSNSKDKNGGLYDTGVAAQADAYTKKIKQFQAQADANLKVNEKFKDLSDVQSIRQTVQANMQLFAQAQKLEKQLDQMHGTSGKFTGTLTEGLVIANQHGSAVEQMYYRVAQSITAATAAATQFSGAIRGVSGGGSAYLRAAGGGQIKAGDLGAVQVQGGGYAFSPALAAAAKGQGPAPNVNNPDLPIGATYNVAPVEGRAKGGSVQAGQPYKVGEWGEEMFVPGSDGFVMDNISTRSAQIGRGRMKKVKQMNKAEITSMLSKYHQLKSAENDRAYTGPDGEMSAYQYGLTAGRFAMSSGLGASYGGPVGSITDAQIDEMYEKGVFGEFAAGGITDRETAWVGERGPELAQFPAGTRVTPNHEIPKQQPVNIQVQAQTVEQVEVQRTVASDGTQLVKMIGKSAKALLKQGAKAKAY